ncbi:MAG: NAD-binding protein [Epsilonproteobacteria bacterium]|nr:NAD-binding protein [Campylobacterota bacterium]
MSFIIPFVSAKSFKGMIPSVALEIIAGLILGRSGFHIIRTDIPALEFLSMFGLIYLMFLSGLEVEFKEQIISAKRFFHSPLFISALIFVFTLSLSYLFSIFLVEIFHFSTSKIYLALIFSTTSVAVVFPTLKSRLDLKKSYRQTLMTSALIADLSTLFMITIFSLLKESKHEIINFLMIFILLIATFTINKIMQFLSGNRWINKIMHSIKYKNDIQVAVRGSFAILFVFLYLANKFGIELIMVSFLAGIIISKTTDMESDIIKMKLDAIGYGFFIPFFFIYQGAIAVMPSNIQNIIIIILIIVIGSFLIKIIASLPLKILFSLKDTIAGGILLSGRLSLIIAASLIGLKLGIINEEFNSAIIILAIVSSVISPTLFSMIKKQVLSSHSSKIIIVGGGRIGSDVAEMFSKKQKDVVVIEKDKQACQKLEMKNISVYCGDGSDIEILDKLKPKKYDKVLLLTDNDRTNIKIARIFEEKYDITQLFARDNEPKNRKLFKENGIVPLVYTEQLLKTVEKAIDSPTVFEFLNESEKAIRQKTITNLYGKTIEEISTKYTFEIILIKRGKKWIYPKNDLLLKRDDIIIFITDKKDEKTIQKLNF